MRHHAVAVTLLLATAHCGGEAPEEDALDETSSALTSTDLSWPTAPPPGPVITPRSNINASVASGAQSSPDVSIDPTNSPYYNHLVAASNDETTDRVRVYETWNGATTWKTQSFGQLGGTYTGATRHPSVAYDAAGNAFVSLVAYDSSGTTSRVAMTRRLVGTSGFSALGVITSSNVDRQRITVDRSSSSPRRGRIYLAWSSGQAVYVSSSSNQGSSFGSSVRVSDSGAATNPYPFVAADGTLYVAWLDPSAGKLRLDRSTDGGLTWGTDRVIHTLAITGATASTVAAPAAGVRLAPFCDIDRSTGPRKNTLFCAYADRNGTSGLDVFLRRSIDGGATWSPARRMNDDASGTGADQFLPRIQIDDGSGKVNVGWYDTRADSAHRKTDIYFTRASDGVSFVPPVRVTNAQTDESRSGADAAAYGEAIGMEAFLGRIRVLWTDARSANEEIYSCIIDFAHFAFYFGGSATQTMSRGGSASLTVRIDAVGPYTADTTLSMLKLPAGSSATFSVNPVPVGGSTTLTLHAGTAAAGTYSISIKGKGGGEESSRAMTMVIQ
jgi:hypothetical protein